MKSLSVKADLKWIHYGFLIINNEIVMESKNNIMNLLYQDIF